MKIILDTKNSLEYIYFEQLTSANSNNILKLENLKYYEVYDKTSDEQKIFYYSFPIGTIFSTLYNLSISKKEELDTVLLTISKKKVEDMNDSEFLTHYLFQIWGSEKIYYDLAASNLITDISISDSIEKVEFIRNTDTNDKMITDKILKLSKEDQLLFCELFHPEFSIKENIYSIKDNYILNFFHIFSYFLLSFCISFLYFSINSVLIKFNQSLEFDDIYKLFYKILYNLESDDIDFNMAYPNKNINLKNLIHNELSLDISEKQIINAFNEFCLDIIYTITNLNIFKLYKEMLNNMASTLDFSYRFSPEEEKKHNFDHSIGAFLLKSQNHINTILKIYEYFDPILADGNDTLPLIYCFIPRKSLAKLPRTILPLYKKILPATTYILLTDEDNIISTKPRMVLRIIDHFIPTYKNYRHKYSRIRIDYDKARLLVSYYFQDDHDPINNIFNTQPKNFPKLQSDKLDTFNSVASPYIDIFLCFFLTLFHSFSPEDNLSYYVSQIYYKYFGYFTFLRQYKPTAKLFPNKNIMYINCTTIKDLLIASFYSYVCFSKFPLKKCSFDQCNYVFLNTNEPNKCMLHHDINENIAYNKTYKSLDYQNKTKYKNNRQDKIYKLLEKLFSISHENIEKITKNEQDSITYVTKKIFKESYIAQVNLEFELFLKPLNSLASQKFYDKNIDAFNILTSFNKGIEPFEVMYTKLLKYKNNREEARSFKIFENGIITEIPYKGEKHVVNNTPLRKNLFENDDQFQKLVQSCIQDLYRITCTDDYNDVYFVSFNLKFYSDYVTKTKNLFINSLIKLYKCNINSHEFVLPSFPQLFSEYNPDEYSKCLKWCKEYYYYNGVKIVLKEISKIESLLKDLIKFSNYIYV